MPSSENRLLDHLPALCNAVRRIALEAGAVTLSYFDDSGYEGADIKGDGSPVTVADQAAERVIYKALTELVPGVPMIGEESVEAGHIPDLTGAEYFWLVDPLDGTKEFIGGGGDYTVNIALIRGRTPVLGVVHAPVHGTLYAGCEGGQAVRYNEDTGKERPIHTRAVPPQGFTVVASRHHSNDAALEELLAGFKVAKLAKKGSSLKICTIAEGKADFYPRLGPTCEWDIAAGDAVLRAAGGTLTDIAGDAVLYRKAADKFLNAPFLAMSGAVADLYEPPASDDSPR